MSKVLITGGTGFIGSHTCVQLQNKGFEVVLIDSLVNSDISVVERLQKITGKAVKFYKGDLCDINFCKEVFEKEDISAVIHFAALKAVGESVAKPLEYYDNNLIGTINLLKTMAENGCKNIVYSSSATVYGDKNPFPYIEGMPCSSTSPYGRTKVIIEDILTDLHTADNQWSIALLRYFNPIGAHESGLIGENPNGIPNNLFPYILKVAMGKLPAVQVFGDDYNTIDGTGVRDYIHVTDLAIGHIKALEYLRENKGTINPINLGSGKGTSVLELINTFSKVNNIDIPYNIVPRRAGDIDEFYADTKLAKKLLNWETTMDVAKMCKDGWNFAKNNL